ncbi:MAG: betaine-aldehyde dehydrogenase [Parvibaculum sp.]|jgi:acyl-CoA reductase-like NAD-dependent aldehyde dehydrogenase|uniref:aldehyde dehydrogenase n=1 Tax=Parvibaculum sp. TaxID=2024848 RepID=UPI000C5A48FA|nr:aldehyde dehydrogenase [Parvibaculum sp.]MAU60231.1 betaine-aldehyde dehydrogenase [Parvibaculum sp.]HAC58579.1 betaine-aldehyde dehydrogenase [Rhodobiaceae bacterium]|tara:strand:- start:1650 stop:3110 length:1461 start_codon:yes stop_codon:yes gene_type:complete
MSGNRVKVAGVEVSTDHWIGGKRVASKERFADFSPIDGSHLADVSAGGKAEADAAVEAARKAFPAWAALGPKGRLPYLKKFAEGIKARVNELAAVETMDNGSLLMGNVHRVVPRAAQNIEFFADWAMTLDGHVIESPEVVNHVKYDPAGVAVLITPWNAPLMLTTWKVGPALAAGNTVVVKPPEWAPLTCSLMADIAHEAGLPPGVLNVVQGIGEVAGDALVNHPDIDRISFTGSTDTAKIIGQAAARSITPMSAELGGKSPFIVCADADLQAAAQTVAGQYMNAGQVCLAGTRIMVEKKIEEQFLEMVRGAASHMTVGDPRDKDTRVGPLIHKEHFERVAGFVERAKADGAVPLWGGGRSNFGELYFEPTLFAHVTPELEIAQREVFGPVLTWQSFSSDDEVVELANNTRYGLAGTLFSGSEKRALDIASRVTAGTVWVNCFFVRDLAAPFGGAKDSGLGREGGTWSFDFYTDIKNISIRKGSFA